MYRSIERCNGETKLKDAVLRTGVGKIKGKDLVLVAVDFAFIGGSMGLLWEKKIARGIDHAIKTNFLCDDFKIGGARMMEAAYSLMQLAKTSVKLAISEAKLPYISLCTDQQLEERLLLCYVR
jgi:acetyl-CoA carboxylase carboxyl transferase subunit beta